MLGPTSRDTVLVSKKESLYLTLDRNRCSWLGMRCGQESDGPVVANAHAVVFVVQEDGDGYLS